MKVMIYASYAGSCGVRAAALGPGTQTIEIGRSTRIQQLNEINSCIDGLLDAGVEEILVWDDSPGDSDCDPVNAYALHGENTFLATCRDFAAPVARLDASFDAAILLGAAAMNHTPGAFMAHTLDPQVCDCIRINGTEIGDIGLFIMANGYFNVPTVLVSGDDKACAEALACGGAPLETVITKKGVSRHKSINHSPAEVCRLLRERAAAAVRNISAAVVCRPEAPFTAELKLISQNCAGQLMQCGAEMTDDVTAVIKSDDFLDLLAQLHGWCPGAHFKRYGITADTADFFSALSFN